MTCQNWCVVSFLLRKECACVLAFKKVAINTRVDMFSNACGHKNIGLNITLGLTHIDPSPYKICSILSKADFQKIF